MPKHSTHPIILNDLPSITTTQLRKLKFFDGDGYKSEPLTMFCKNNFNSDGDEIGTMNVAVSIQDGNSYIEFEYVVNEKRVNYKLDLVQVPSNMGKGGHLWYFLCPQTGERCSKLYMYDNYLVSRKTIKGALYKGQVKSRSMRFDEFDKNFILFHKLTAIILGGQDKYYKRWYKGLNTKKHLILLQAVEARKNLLNYFNMMR